MAWVNRTTRDSCSGGLQVKVSTSAYLGPGCYETSPSRQVRPNAAGFGSGEKLVRGANAGSTKGSAMITPGPGAYTTSNQTTWESPTKSKALATSIFQSKSQRLGEVKLRRGYSTPGPGAYSKQDPFAQKSKTLGNPLVRTPSSNNKIRWTRLPTAPSIPTVSQSFGYEQGAYGKLVRHEPAKVGHTGCGNDTLGPGEYEPMRGLKSINKTRTTDFSKGKVTRFIEHEVRSKAEVPGPGEYTNTGETTVPKDPARVNAVFKSALTREQAAPTTTTKNVPGPGASIDAESAVLFTTDGAILSSDVLVPGPGAYYYPPSGNTHQPRSVPSRKKAPFSSKKERFEAPKEKDQCLAAPGSYEIPSAVSEVLNKVVRMHHFVSWPERTLTQICSAFSDKSRDQFRQYYEAVRHHFFGSTPHSRDARISTRTRYESSRSRASAARTEQQKATTTESVVHVRVIDISTTPDSKSNRAISRRLRGSSKQYLTPLPIER
ncbi:unnamed protein product [Phytophthora lilii]|uniref:Unnamed protein product n=1 Tax=Phytophthora lilii TaxID=2077276 RepID=A0A9W6TKX7_9STRA|nr:unnamed protein product [Phytophthora lilii]